MAKRRLISLLPGYQQTTDLRDFFGCTIDEVFQPGNSQPISGYIGRHTASDLPGDFYVGEPTDLRRAYQLEAGMVSYDADKNLINALTYPDFIAYLQTAGAIVDDQQRLTETDYYSWSPPLNPDMLMNYHEYFWFGDLAGVIDHPALMLTIPYNVAIYDGSTATFALPDSIIAVPAEQEVPTIYVIPPGGTTGSVTSLLPDPAFTVDDHSITLVDPPATGSTLVISRVASFVAVISGQSNADISDLNDQGVTKLSSGMRIKVIDATYFVGAWDIEPWDIHPVDPTPTVPTSFGWDFSGMGTYMVDGVGDAMRLTADERLFRDTKPQYITIERSSRDGNLWSRHNLWVHKDTFAWAQNAQFLVPLAERRAKRPIIEFIRDIKLWQQSGQLATTAQQGTTSLPLMQALPNITGRAVTGTNIARNTVVTQVLGTNVLLSKPVLDDIPSGTTITFRQVWVDESEAIDRVGNPLFMLYDLDGVPLNDVGTTGTPGVYPGSDFIGNSIFDYAISSTAPADPVLLWPLQYDANGYNVFENTAATHRYTSDNGSIDGLYLYGVDDGTLTTYPLWHRVSGTTPQGMTDGFFDVPLNLQANPNYDDIGQISRSTWTTHFASIIGNQPNIVGQPLASNNFRDTGRDLTLGTSILQHDAPLLKAMLLASTATYDLPAAIRFAEQEYRRFRNKFLRKLTDLYNNGTLLEADLPRIWVTTALRQIKRDKTSQFPFSLNVIGGDQYFIPPTPTCLGILPAAVPGMVIDTTYSPTAPLILGHDGSLTPAFGILLTLYADLPAGDVIPADPTGMRVDQLVLGPNIPVGTRIASIAPTSITLTTPTTATIASGTVLTVQDWRDPILLALEQVIYDNLPTPFRTEARPRFDIQRWLGGRFYTPDNGYSNDEVATLLTPLFELWAQQHRLDYRSHADYDYNDPFTWNYRGIRDFAGNPLPGSWRAIYRWYYDTDAPHLRPWELLGFVSQPSWWETAYGVDYSSQNTALWSDLEHGTIQDGPRQGTDPRYARSGLNNIIPVDAQGNLLDPVAAGIVAVNVTLSTGARGWLPGDVGPVEAQWRNTASYRYALATISFLTKPARFVEACWDLLGIGFVGNQWVDVATNGRPLNTTRLVHGEIVNGAAVSVTGISQWLADAMLSAGITSTALGVAVRGLDVRLIHQMAGFTSTADTAVVADNFGLVPTEDVAIVLYTSPITRSEVYSGVILEWSGRSWRVIGYDGRDANFTIIPPDTNGPKGVISIATVAEPHIVPWHPNTFFPVGILVEEYNSVWQCLRSHTSSSVFEQTFWQSRPGLSTAMIRAPRVVTYLRGLPTTKQVPYGTELNSNQDVADFLLGYQRWLISRGWTFDDVDQASGEIRDWSLSVKEFLTWSQVQWASGNFIALSPGLQHLKFTTANGMISNVESDRTGFFGLLDRSGNPIGQRDAIINRLDGDIDIHAKSADIYAARLDIAEMEHLLVFSNRTIFDDTIYLPLYNVRQLRLRLICKRSQDWAGRLDAPGFMITGDTLSSDFEKAAEDVRMMFDIETPDRSDLRKYARHNIGFQERDYMESLLLSDVESFEFYQGMIQQKGAPGVFRKLMRSNRASNNSNLQFLEEWAIRLAEFGAPLDPFLTLQLSQVDMRDDPQIIRFVTTNAAPLDWMITPSGDQRWIDQPRALSSFFTMAAPLAAARLPAAGPVRLNEVTYTAFYLHDLPDFYTVLQTSGQQAFPTGSLTWVYDRGDETFSVLRSFETASTPNSLTEIQTFNEDSDIDQGIMRLFFTAPLSLTANDIGNYLVIDDSSKTVPDIQGLIAISAIDLDANTVDVAVANTLLGHLFGDDETAPVVRVLREVRFADRASLTAANYPFVNGDRVWIDTDLNDGWVVLQWNNAWNVVRQQPVRTDPRTISETVIYQAGTTISGLEMFIDEPVVDDVVVIDPLAGLIASVADRDIDYKLGTDPARYNANGGFAINPWGPNEVGRVWWDLSTVRFLDPFTDTLGLDDQRDYAELAYRIANWSHIAPNTSVNVYEWIESTVSPVNYDGPGTLLGSNRADFDPTTVPWAERTVFDTKYGRVVTLYYFWVTGLTTTPSVSFRHVDISTIALAIENPAGLGLAWLAPISSDALVISGVAQFLNDTSTVLKIRLTPIRYPGPLSSPWTINSENAGRHNQWLLMRPTDETSLPTWQIWQKLRDSLAGFNSAMQPVPDPMLSPLRATGVRQPQSMFVTDGATGPRSGLRAARQSFIGIVNTILGRSPMRHDRLPDISTLYRSTLRSNNAQAIDPLLIWAQPNTSYIVEPPPQNEWDVEVFSIAERDRLLGRSDFLEAAGNSGPNIRVLLNGMANAQKQWSIWEFDAAAANALLSGGLAGHGEELFTIAPAYDYVVQTRDARNALSLGDADALPRHGRVLVVNDTDNFWTIWKYSPNSQRPPADVFGYVLWRVQSYRTDDFISVVDWYAEGYSPANPPITTYETLSDRNAAPNFISEGAWPISIFVKVNDDGTSNGDPTKKRWIWSIYDTTLKQWQTVAMQGGTIALSSNFYGPTRHLHASNTWQSVATGADATDTSLTLSSGDGVGVGQFVIGPGIAHTTMVTAVEGNVVSLDTPLNADVPEGAMMGFTNMALTDISTRDGSWELFVLADALRYGTLLTDQEINEVFFSCLNFVHVQQDSVDWAFKTSFMTIIGYNVPLQQTPVLLADQTPSLVSYIQEVKPYHCKIRDFSTQYNPDIDLVNTTIDGSCAFDFALLFDRIDINDTWDIHTWDRRPWDADILHTYDTRAWGIDHWDVPDRDVQVYLHTAILGVTDTIQVDDIRFLRSYGDVDVTPVLINILDGETIKHSYLVNGISEDAVNISTTAYANALAPSDEPGGPTRVVGISGQLTTMTPVDDDITSDMIVEAVIELPDRVLRELLYNTTAGDQPSAWWISHFGLDMRPSIALYTIAVDAHAGDTSLPLDRVNNIGVGQPVFGPNIPKGTLVSSVSSALIAISQPILQDIVAGTSVAIGLPISISGAALAAVTPEVTYDASDLADVTPDTLINPPLASRPGGYDFRPVYHDEDHPEERVPFTGDDALHMLVTSLATSGGPPQMVKAFDVSAMASPATLFFNFIAQSATAVLVYRDGVRLQVDSDYTVDYFARTITVNLSHDTQEVLVHAFGFGGTSAITDVSYLSFTSNPLTIPESTTTEHLVVVIDGVPTSEFTVTDDQVTLTGSVTLDSDVAIVVYDGDASTASQISVLPYAYTGSQQWMLDPNDDQTIPEHAGTIVEVNGLRLTPPPTYYGQLTPSTPWMPIGIDPPSDPSQVMAYIDGELYSQVIPVCTGTDPSSTNLYHLVVPGSMPSPPGQLVFYQNYLIALDPIFNGNVAVAVRDASIGSTALNADYDVEDGVLTIFATLSDAIQVTTFSNAGSMGMQTWVYAAESNVPFVVSMPSTPYYTLVTLDGAALVPEQDYVITVKNATGPFTAGPRARARPAAVLTLTQPSTGALVITSFTMVAEEFHQWMSNSRMPASLRMPLVYDNSGQPLVGAPNNGPDIPKKLHGLLDEYIGVSPYMAGTLVNDLAVHDAEMTVQLYLRDISPKLLPGEPLSLPTPLAPGAVWVGGERIEYFGYERIESNVVKLKQLRRATHGTSSSLWHSGSVVYNGDHLIVPIATTLPTTSRLSASPAITGLAMHGVAGRPTTAGFSSASASPRVSGVVGHGIAGLAIASIPSSLSASPTITGVTAHGTAGVPSITGTTLSASKAIVGVAAHGAAGIPITTGAAVSRAIVGVAGTGAAGIPSSTSSTGSGTTVPLLNKALYYLSGVDPAQVAAHATTFDVKCFDPTSDGGTGNTFWSSAQVAAAKGGHGICLAYFDCGGLEPGRYYYDSTTRAISSYPSADEWGEYAIEFWTTTWLNITTAWIDKAMAAGFDGIYLDVVDGFGGSWVVSRAPAIGGSAAGTGAAAGKQMIAYVQNVRNYCQTKKPGFLVWVNSGVYGSDGFDVPLTDTATYGSSPRYVDVIDGMFIEEVLYSYSGGSVKANSSANRTDMHTALSPVVTAGKPVSLVEYCGSGGVTVVGGVTNAIHDVRNTATAWSMGYYISVANYPNPDLGIVDMEGITTP